jgi:peptide/nickel transport system substrate-binding protein
MAACPGRKGSNGSGSVKPRPGSGAVDRETTLRVRLASPIPHLNPLKGSNMWVWRLTFPLVVEPLVTVRPRTGKAQGVLAESWHPLERDGKVMGYRIRLREGVSWHDGRPFTAEDVRFSLAVATNGVKAGKAGKAALSRLEQAQLPVADVSIFGDRVVEVWLNAPYGPFIERLSQVPMLPAHRFEECGFENTCPNDEEGGERKRARFCRLRLDSSQCSASSVEIVGTGPFQLLQWWPSEKLIYVRNESYWGQRPGMKRLEFVIIQAIDEAIDLMQRGKLHVLADLSTAEWRRAEEKLSARKGKRFRTVAARPLGRSLAVFRNIPNRFVRRAMALLLDRKGLAKRLPGGPSLIRHPVCRGSREQSLFAGAHYSGGRERAEALLDKAGYKKGKGGIRRRGAIELRLNVVLPEGAELLRSFFVSKEDDLKKAGVGLDVRTVPRIAYVAALLGKSTYGEYRTRTGPLYPGQMHTPGMTVVQLGQLSRWTDFFASFHSSHAIGPRNPSELRDRVIDELLTKWLTEPEVEKRRKLEAKILERIWQQAPVVPLFGPIAPAIRSHRVTGLEADGLWLDFRRAKVR